MTVTLSDSAIHWHCVPRSPKWLKTGLKNLAWIFIHAQLVVNPSANMKKINGGILEKIDFLDFFYMQVTAFAR